MSTTSVVPELGHMADVPMKIDVELDRRILKLIDVLELRSGSVLPLAKPAGEPLDIYVGGARLGSGEVVVFNDNFGIRITSLATGTI
ncbi:MAG TPA: FliM/FliN family flagellar motor switch protein [Bryobacteraceae bacterium]|nr:FliM/FliN family flagellar motor switch protein [Bryobacteraceae bacterium]